MAGFFVGANGLVATVCHGFLSKQEVKMTAVVKTHDLAEHPAELVVMDVNTDCALLQIRLKQTPFLPLAQEESETGDRLDTCGCPRGNQFTVSSGVLAFKTEESGCRVFQHTCWATTGSSGGQLVNELDEVVGMQSYLINKSIPMAVSARHIQALMDVFQKKRAVAGVVWTPM